MTLVDSVGLSHEFPISSYCFRINRNKGLNERGHSQLVSLNLSSSPLRQDALSVYLFRSVQGPIKPLSIRYNGLMCKSFLLPGISSFPPRKSGAVVCSRTCRSYIAGIPLMQEVITGIGIMAFAAWGISPLIRVTRNIFLRRSDSSWKKSSMHCVLTSYIRPLLLWTGATLLCSALDPVILPTEASQAVKQRLLIFVRSLSTVLAFAYCLSSLVQQAQKIVMEKNDPEYTRNMGFQFAGKAIYTAVWIAAVSLFMELLGFSTQKWMTAGGLGTVLLTLAGREIFTNFLSSVMIHATRPFVLNERIKTKIGGSEVSGRVEHVGWWSQTIVRGDDREAVHVPNHKFTVNVVRNLSHKTHWRIKTHLAISHLDFNKINNIVADMRKVLAKYSQVEQQGLHRRVFLDYINPENLALMIMVSCFVKTSHSEEYLCVKEAILHDLLKVISHHHARLATPIRTVQNMYNEADIDNIPFSESTITRTKPAADIPLLLVEKKTKRTCSGSSQPVRKKEGNNTVDTITGEHTSEKSPLPCLKSSSQTAKNPKTTSQGKQPSPKTRLDENIVLGVALDSGKQTLPVEDEIVSCPSESKELAA